MVDFRSHVDRILAVSVEKFGEEVRFFPQAGGSFCVRAIFDNEYSALDPDTEQVISVNQPILGVNLNDFKNEIQIDDQVEVRKVRFRIQDKREDGQGGARLLLHKVRKGDRLRDTKAP